MKVPLPVSCKSTLNSDPNPSRTTTNNNININNNTLSLAPANLYEPTSVLELGRTPSPVTKPVSAPDPIDWDDHVLENFNWDSIMRELDFHDHNNPPSTIKFDTHPTVLATAASGDHHVFGSSLPGLDVHTQFVHHPDYADVFLNSIAAPNNTNNQDFSSLELSQSFHNLNSNSNLTGFDSVQELIRAADCFDSNQFQLAHAILERLNSRLQSPSGKPLHRAAFFFKEALQSLLTVSTRPPAYLSSWSETVETIRAYRAFSGISPIPMFAHFTANQALLDSLDGPSSPFIHVVDFDIGLGCQYASFMRELAERGSVCKFGAPILRVTAVVTEEYAIETKLIRESLNQFADELKLRFQIEFVLLRTFEMLSFKSIKFVDGEKTAVLLSPSIFRRLSLTSGVTAFVSDLRRVSPSVVVFVDGEAWGESGTSSFRRNFVNNLEFYSIMFESLDGGGAAMGSGEWVRKIETLLMRPRILAAVEGCGRGAALPPWKEVFAGAGMWPIGWSQFADFQAETLLGKVQSRGFYVAKRQAELVLCWHDRPLVATSAWRC
ncbi:Scarecrow-like protein 15 [Linum perenne]